MAVTAHFTGNIVVEESFTDTGIAAANNSITTSLTKVAKVDADTPVPATKTARWTTTLTAGAATIDLTSLTGANGASVTATGLKLQMLGIKPGSANT
ncbi:MAG: hypothetical protein GY851_09900, partial [bacterium]|nr:hypothetical protein [bacterium]